MKDNGKKWRETRKKDDGDEASKIISQELYKRNEKYEVKEERIKQKKGKKLWNEEWQ